ncbi:MAG: TlpA family protein disulfide reductase [Paracoccaceae bacterium]
MRLLQSLVLYAGLALGANTAVAADLSETAALETGDLEKIRFAEAPAPVSDVVFADAEGNPVTLADYRGEYVLLNFWALWCAPCREEMPAFDRLMERMDGAPFRVVTVATGRNALPRIVEFFEEHDLTNLPILLDPKMELAQSSGALGLPVTLLINPDGQEVARAQGALHWDSDAAVELFRSWMAKS